MSEGRFATYVHDLDCRDVGCSENGGRTLGGCQHLRDQREPRWVTPGRPSWDYTLFARPGAPGASGAPDAADGADGAGRTVIDLAFEKIPRGHGQFNSFRVNGKEYPHDQEFVLRQGERYRMIWRNRSTSAAGDDLASTPVSSFRFGL